MPATEVAFPRWLLGANRATELLQLAGVQGLDTLLLQPALQQDASGISSESLQRRPL